MHLEHVANELSTSFYTSRLVSKETRRDERFVNMFAFTHCISYGAREGKETQLWNLSGFGRDLIRAPNQS